MWYTKRIKREDLKMKKKIASVLLALTLVLGTAFFTACGGSGGADDGGAPGGEAPGKATINVWVVAPVLYNYNNVLKLNPNDKQALLTKWIIERFKELHPETTVNLQNKGWGDNLNRELATGLNLKGASAPDIVVGEQYLRTFIDSDSFIPLDLDTELKDDIITQARKVVDKDGKFYAVPIVSGVYGLNINLAALRSVGILDANNAVRDSWRTAMAPYIAQAASADASYTVSPAAEINPLAPATWEDLLAICYYIRAYYDRAVTVDGNTYAGSDGVSRGGMVMTKAATDSHWQSLPYMRTAGGDFVDATGTVTVGSDANKLAFGMMRRLSAAAGTSAIASADTNMDIQFYRGYGAYQIQGAELVTRAYNYSQYIDEDDVLAVELPVFSSVNLQTNTMVGSVFMSINKNKQSQSAHSVNFIKFLLSDEVQLKFMSMDGRIPVKKSLLKGGQIKEQNNYAKIKPFIDMYSNWDFDGMLYGFPNNASQVWTAWNIFVNKLFNPAEDLNAALATAQTDMRYYAERD
jgi:ABC-type glycerol-3-phosphate transport system substrate-binding protein